MNKDNYFDSDFKNNDNQSFDEYLDKMNYSINYNNIQRDTNFGDDTKFGSFFLRTSFCEGGVFSNFFLQQVSIQFDYRGAALRAGPGIIGQGLDPDIIPSSARDITEFDEVIYEHYWYQERQQISSNADD